MTRLRTAAAAVLALATPAYAADMFAVAHTDHGYYCQPESLKDVILSFNEAAKAYKTPAPQVDYDRLAKVGGVTVTYIDWDDYSRQVIMLFSKLAVCNAAAAEFQKKYMP